AVPRSRPGARPRRAAPRAALRGPHARHGRSGATDGSRRFPDRQAPAPGAPLHRSARGAPPRRGSRAGSSAGCADGPLYRPLRPDVRPAQARRDSRVQRSGTELSCGSRWQPCRSLVSESPSAADLLTSTSDYGPIPAAHGIRSVGMRWYTCRVLEALCVENLLLIERTELAFAPGLNVLTGETGAGKTVLAHALDLLMGGRSRSGIVRPGGEEAYVEGAFSVPESMREELSRRLPENVRCEGELEQLVLARRVRADGQTRAYLNGRTAAVGDLRDIGGRLIAFYGQHEHRKLVLASAQLQMLDEVCPASHARRLQAC